mmetsp:Transcript_12327/g.23373  ORF Transcript_12327/g.23373 Transcript_12327/m.23373 type:complete len:124 (-) Transcript_12327:22-393(-)
MADPDAVAKAFVAHYYNVFDTNRQGLAALFQPTSMMTFEGEKFQGPEAIVGKLMKLQFAQCRHVTNIIDAQPTPSGGVLVFCTGNIQTENQERPLLFSEVFHLLPTPEGSFFVFNNMFRLNFS